MFELIENVSEGAQIRVIGVGGGGGNAVAHMSDSTDMNVEYLCTNTDAQALRRLRTASVLHIGAELTKGLGAGANPEVGRAAAQENREQIAEALRGADLVFITAGMGGGTGTGAAPVIAEVAKDLGVLCVAVVTKPFKFEGKKRMQLAESGIEELRQCVDSLIIIPNEKLISVLGKNCSLLNAFNAANDVLKNAVQGIADLITRPGMMNVDFADVRTVMSAMGMAMMGSGSATGEDRAKIAAQQALASPLLEDIDLQGARGVLVNITASEDLSLGEFTEVGELIYEYADEDATVVIGTAIDPSLDDQVKVSVVATGLDRNQASSTDFNFERTSSSLASQGSKSQKDAPGETEVEPRLVSSSERVESDFDIRKVDLPEILKPRRVEALLNRGEPEKVIEDLKYLDIPTYARQ